MDTAVLVPGWANDCRIFATLDLPYNYLLPISLGFFDFEQELLGALQERSIKKVYLLGWSLGGFLVMDFVKKNYPLIKELVLLSITKEFDNNLLKEIAEKIKKNKRAYLYKFYQDCFSAEDRTGRCWFKKNLFRDYIDSMRLEDLMVGLDYLSCARLKPKDASGIDKVRIFHGEKDQIMPFSDAVQIRSEFNKVDFTALSNIGHICFLNFRFKEKFYHG